MKVKLGILMTLILGISGISEVMAITGSWRGELSMGVVKLPLVFNFKENPSGDTEATLDSPQQNAKGIPLQVIYCSKDSINVECKMIGASYIGRISDNRIDGEFSQRGYKFPLTLTLDDNPAARRPQTPVPPFSYIVKDTVFLSSDGTELAGTLTCPVAMSDKKYPLVIMVTGSGPQNRDEELFEHKPFAVIADYLAGKGIASFRYDDRGTASSKGDYSTATIETFMEDLKSASRMARSLGIFDKFGIIGHSEGGTLAVLTASDINPDFIVSLAGMMVPTKEVLLAQNAHSMTGMIANHKEATLKLLDIIFDKVIQQSRNGVSSDIDIDMIIKENSLEVPDAVVESIKQFATSRDSYLNSLICLDPTDALRSLKCPILAINGTKDTQINADTNLEACERFADKSEIRKMEGLNHLMQHADTGEVTEYGEITETISPEVLEIISTFILCQ